MSSSTSIETLIIDSLLEPVFTRRNGTRRMSTNYPRERFIRSVFSSLVTISSILFYLLGYRKGTAPYYSQIAAGFTYICYWAIARYSTQSKIDFTTISWHYFVFTFILSLVIEFVGILVAIVFSSSQLLIAVSIAVFTFWFGLLMLALAQSTQMIFGGRHHEQSLESPQSALLAPLLLLSLLFIFLHFQVNLWPQLVHFTKSGNLLKCTRTVATIARQMLALKD